MTRKSLITDALQFLQLAKLIDETNGIYSARNPDDGDAYRTPYLAGLQLVSSWMKERSNQIGYRRFADEMREAVMKLAEEYLSSRPPRENTDVHNWLKTSYESDILRLEGLQDACDVFECLLDVEFKSASNDNGAIIPPLGYFKDVHAAATKEIISTLSSYTDLLQIS